MMFGGSPFHDPITQLAGFGVHCWRFGEIHGSENGKCRPRFFMLTACVGIIVVQLTMPKSAQPVLKLFGDGLMVSRGNRTVQVVDCWRWAVCVALIVVFIPKHAQAYQQKQPVPTRYSHGPDSMIDQDVPQGTIEEFTHLDSKIYPGTKRRFYTYVPKQYDPSKPAALMVFQDGHAYVNRNGEYRAPVVMDNLIDAGQIPVTIGVFVDPGHKKDKLPEKPGWRPSPENRAHEYDRLSDDYVRFLLEEILPKVESKYKITKDPAGRAICGASSGGICAFTAAWEKPDQFSKVISHIGSFVNIRHGDTYPGIIRKTEKKPIRVYLQDGSNDLDNEHGNWPLANQQMAKALEYKNYDFKFEYGGGAHSGNHGGAILPDAMRWIWRDYPGVKPLPLSLTANVQTDEWALAWWGDRHLEKLEEKKKMKKIEMIMIGDSITHHFEDGGKEVWDQYFKRRHVLNLGFSGDRTENVLWRLRNGEVEGLSPKLITLMIGTNNTGHRTEPPEETAAGIKEILRELRARMPQAKILLLAIFPRDKKPDGKMRKQNDAINAIIKDFGDDKDIFYLDIADKFLDKDGNLPKEIMPDALHPNVDGYRIWAKAIMPGVKKLLKK